MPHPIDLTLGRRIRARRRVLGLTQAAVAAEAGVRFQQVAKFECATSFRSEAGGDRKGSTGNAL